MITFLPADIHPFLKGNESNMFYFSHACECRFQLKSGDGYSFCTFIFPSNLSNTVR